MSAETKVDVLAVMDAAASRSQERAASIGGDSWIHQQSADAMRQARAAVAELIEAARELLAVSEMAAMLNVFPGNPNANGPLPRTRAALSRIGGAK